MSTAYYTAVIAITYDGDQLNVDTVADMLDDGLHQHIPGMDITVSSCVREEGDPLISMDDLKVLHRDRLEGA